MNYNQIVTGIKTILESHPIIKEVRFMTPQEWLLRDSQPVFPVALYNINTGSFGKGLSLDYTCTFWFLDKSGQEAEFETEVISDQHSIALDIVNKLRNDASGYLIDDSVTWNAVSEKYEDYLSGIEITININVVSEYGNCDFPV